jgi:hypothetical protein
MTTVPVDLEVGRSSVPGRRTLFRFILVTQDAKAAHLVQLGSLEAGIGHRHSFAADDVAHFKTVLRLRRLADCDDELTQVAFDGPVDAKDVALVGVTSLVE